LQLTGKHGLVHASRPIELRDELELRLRRAPMYRLHRARVPAIHITGRHNDLGLRVCLDELLCKRHARPIADCLAVAEQLVPLFAAEFTLPVVLGCQSVGPHEAVGGVLDRRGHHVVAIVKAQLLQCCPQRCCACPSQAKSQHSHGHHPAAFSAVDVGVGGREDVGDGLRGVGLECHCGGGGYE